MKTLDVPCRFWFTGRYWKHIRHPVVWCGCWCPRFGLPHGQHLPHVLFALPFLMVRPPCWWLVSPDLPATQCHQGYCTPLLRCGGARGRGVGLRPCWLTEGLKPSIINGDNGGTWHINLLKMSFHFLESRLSHGLANLEARGFALENCQAVISPRFEWSHCVSWNTVTATRVEYRHSHRCVVCQEPEVKDNMTENEIMTLNWLPGGRDPWRDPWHPLWESSGSSGLGRWPRHFLCH